MKKPRKRKPRTLKQLARKAKELTKGMRVDLNAPIDGPVSL